MTWSKSDLTEIIFTMIDNILVLGIYDMDSQILFEHKNYILQEIKYVNLKSLFWDMVFLSTKFKMQFILGNISWELAITFVFINAITVATFSVLYSQGNVLFSF